MPEKDQQGRAQASQVVLQPSSASLSNASVQVRERDNTRPFSCILTNVIVKISLFSQLNSAIGINSRPYSSACGNMPFFEGRCLRVSLWPRRSSKIRSNLLQGLITKEEHYPKITKKKNMRTRASVTHRLRNDMRNKTFFCQYQPCNPTVVGMSSKCSTWLLKPRRNLSQ